MKILEWILNQVYVDVMNYLELAQDKNKNVVEIIKGKSRKLK